MAVKACGKEVGSLIPDSKSSCFESRRMPPKVSEIVGVKGMRVQHRAFTYQEKKFNNYGRSGLVDAFKQKYSPEKIQRHFLVKHGKDITMKDAKKVALELEEREWEERKESITTLVDTILMFADRFNITNIEAFAMTCHLYKAVGGKGEPTEQQVGEILDRVSPMVNKLRLDNWDKFMRILKEVT